MVSFALNMCASVCGPKHAFNNCVQSIRVVSFALNKSMSCVLLFLCRGLDKLTTLKQSSLYVSIITIQKPMSLGATLAIS